MTTLHGRLVLPTRVVSGSLVTRNGRIVEVAERDPRDSPEATGHSEGYVLPGLVDLHVHGGGGLAFGADPVANRRVVEFHRRRGTTQSLASLVTAPLEGMTAAIGALDSLVESGEILGVHLEGPFLARARCGAHDPQYLRPPSEKTLRSLIQVGDEPVRMVTVAPELEGSLHLIELLREQGIIAAVGHTAATYAEATRAFRHGATVATHLFNGMPPIHHREGGASLAALLADGVTNELIADHVHVSAEMVRLAFTVAPGRVALVTDAMAAAGMGDGDYPLGERTVQVRGGKARLGSEGSLAGSTLTMDAAVRGSVAAGIDLATAVRAASLTPAEVLGIDSEVGSLTVGKQADLVVVDESLFPRRVMRGGEWL